MNSFTILTILLILLVFLMGCFAGYWLARRRLQRLEFQPDLPDKGNSTETGKPR